MLTHFIFCFHIPRGAIEVDSVFFPLARKNEESTKKELTLLQKKTISTADLKAVRGVYWSDLCNI